MATPAPVAPDSRGEVSGDRRIAEARGQGQLLADLAWRRLLAAGLADAGEIESSLTTIDHIIAETQQSGIYAFQAENYRIRGEILLKHDPTNTAPAEEALLTAIAIAQQQKAKSFELRAALALARLYQNTNRAADAYAALAPALEGFSPTPEFPEIEQAQRLCATIEAKGEWRMASSE